MSKNIKFVAQSEHVWEVRPKPYPAAKNLPQWWKDMPVYMNDEKSFKLTPRPNLTVKRCSPTIEMLTMGYYVPLWADIYVEHQGGFPYIKWNTSESVLESWNIKQVDNFQFQEGYSRTAFKNLHGWTIKTPPGWSCLFIHPSAYPDVPFQTISGVVDTDVFDGEINVPFVIKENFEGLIKVGTPMFQVIPFKRESWESTFEVKKTNKHYFDLEKLYSNSVKSYRSLIKNEKRYK